MNLDAIDTDLLARLPASTADFRKLSMGDHQRAWSLADRGLAEVVDERKTNAHGIATGPVLGWWARRTVAGEAVSK